MQRGERLFNMENSSIETRFFHACEYGDINQAERLLECRDFDPTRLIDKKTAEEGRTCLHLAVLAGDKVFLKKLVEKINQQNITDKRDKQGDTALHLAVWKYRVDLVKVLLDNCKADLNLTNNKGETPLCIAVKFGFPDVVKKMIDRELETVKMLCKEKKILLHAVKLNRVKIVEFLIKKSAVVKKSGILRELINQRVEDCDTKPSGHEVFQVSRTKVSDNKSKRDEETGNSPPIVAGDTPLHIAAKNKNEPIVDFLLKVQGVNKHALNSERKTPLDVAREVTDYNESFRIIKKLTDYPRRSRPFMYCAPEVDQEKDKRARYAVNKSFDERRNAELVVAALVATMAFTAVFTVPGGSYQDSDDPKRGTPILLGYAMFKLFLIFDCIAFFLSLFVCIMWQMASELTTEDKMLFMSVSSLLTALSLGFNSCGFMAAVYTILAHKERGLAWVILGNLLFIALCGAIAFIHQMAMFLVGRARFHRLCGVPRRLDDAVEKVWKRAERSGFLHLIRKVEEACHDAIEGDEPSKKADEEKHEHEHGYNSSCSSSPCLRNVPQSV
ncbi:hypothetical protein SUGI_1087850 [Cryptomeria japonica]|uniref:ankyrin repeat-containing protein At5g02620 n=1 Tax=Cryptomeria japonica TaxID=3369 RepID=UPI002414B98C|nr:ankyrin repeat-containing protein At5g02620 [Cryptomeria japonica]GLJ51105.1 hypothetical protein SUGI_1087850 [Cryptomeria japonica]